MDNSRINIATALNSRYMRYTYVMLTSLFRNQPDADIHVYLLHSDLTESDQTYLLSLAKEYSQNIHFLFIDQSLFSDKLPTTSSWPLEAYYRLLLLNLLPLEVERILYLDVDMIINKPISKLYFTGFENSYFCVCRDMGVSLPLSDIRNEIFKEHISNSFTYFNSGMMLWNIKELRSKYSFNDYMDLAQRLNFQILAPDQDLLNFMHWNQVKFVDEYQYNLFSKLAYNNGVRYQDVLSETTIVHFAGMKPWEGEYVHYDIEQLWWDYAKLTPFYYELMEEFMHNVINNPIVPDTLSSLAEEKKTLSQTLAQSNAMCQKLLQLLN